ILPQLTKPITILPCKHIFHHDCIINRDSSQLLCPICERATEPSQTSFVADILGENLQISSLEKSQESSVEGDDKTDPKGPLSEESSEESSDGADSKGSPRITHMQKQIQGLIMELSTPTRVIVETSSDGEQSLSNTETTNPTALDLARLF